MCPVLVKYPKEFQKKAANQLERSPQEIQEMVTDYAKLRQACRSLKD